MTTGDANDTIPAGSEEAEASVGAPPGTGAPDGGQADEAAGFGSGGPGNGSARGDLGPLRRLSRNLFQGLRIALSLRVEPGRLAAEPADLVLLAALDFLLNLAISFFLVGRAGFFAYSAVPSFYFHLPLFLLLGLLAAKVLGRPRLATALPVALVSLSIPIELTFALVERLAQLKEFGWLIDYLSAPHYYRFFWWWSATALIFLMRLPAPGIRPAATVVMLFLVLVLPPLWYYPRGDLWVTAAESGESGELHLTEEVLDAQESLLEEELARLLPGRKGSTDLYFVGFAGDASQDVFVKELMAAERVFSKRFGTAGRSVLLANNPTTATTLPYASAGNLERAIARVGEVMNRDEDLLLVFLTSHGSKDHELAVNNPPLELNDITPEKLRGMLQRAGIRYRIVVVSACYSGGFIDPLKDDDSLIITAADETHESFGCGYGEKFTWFGEAFLDHALRETVSLTAAFEATREIIGKWEEEQGETPSNPQMWLGKSMEKRLSALEKQLAGKPGQ